MSEFNWEEFKKGNILVLCKTQESERHFWEEASKQGITWGNGIFLKYRPSLWWHYRQRTCYYRDPIEKRTCLESLDDYYAYGWDMDVYDWHENELCSFKNLSGKVVDLTISDVFSGKAEFLHDDGDSITVKWISGSACYDSSVYPVEMYTEPTKYHKNLIHSIEEAPAMTHQEIEIKRAESILMDAPIFTRYGWADKEEDWLERD